MKKSVIFLSLVGAILYFGSSPVMAQRGRGGAGHPGGGSSGAGMSGPGMQGGGHPMGMPSETPMPSQRGRQGDSAGTPRGGPGEHPMGRPEQTGREAQMGQKPTMGEQLERNPKLTSRLQGVLPEGANLQEASAGFKNLGEFVAAAHVSHNLGIPFGEMKTKMTSGKNLGEAIHELRPNVDHNAEAKKAEEQAKKDIRESRP
ncbi:MAG: hypothetical protein HY647_01955 [Acidobacteria bacterium]|nr:hypothetical protein [Acidobacteriota bacterium]